jgi:hypothetical protein
MRRLARAAAIALVLGGAVFAVASQAPQETPVQPMPDVDLTFRQQANLTPQEMLTRGQEDLNSMQAGLKRVVQLQELARKQNDIIKLNCVNDKLVQIKAAINIGEQSMTDLHEAIARNDEGSRVHAFTKLTIVTQKVLVLVQEAENCVGQDLSFVGETTVETEIDPNVPPDDPTQAPMPTASTDRPPEASPFI